MVVVQPPDTEQATQPKTHAVDLKRSAKGLYYWEITVRTDDYDELLTRLQDIDYQLRMTYPHDASAEPITKKG